MDGALMEVGPFRVGDNRQIKLNEGTWMQTADLLFVDQPGGTGFSYTDVYDRELYEASAHFVTFLKNYFKTFPEDAKKQIYIAGESYAGQYIPYFADYILKENAKDNDFSIDLKGLLIGNGWIEPDLQSLSYVPFFLDNNLIDKNNSRFDKVLRDHEKCQNAIADPNDNSFEKSACNRVMDTLLRAVMEGEGGIRTCINMYDYRKNDFYPACGANWPEDLVRVTPFLNIKEVQDGLNLKNPKVWQECDSTVSRYFSPSASKKSFELLPDLLKQIPIMLFSGDKDIICNHLGTEMLIEKLDIGNKEPGFTNDSLPYKWYYNDAPVGEIRAQNNLSYVKIFDSSHMVPYDLPEVSRGLLDIMFPDSATFGGKFMTPVYDYSTDDFFYSSTEPEEEQDSTDNKTSEEHKEPVKHGLSFYFFEFVVLALLGTVFFYFYRQYTGSSTKSSFLSTSASRKKKRVHWFDDSGEEDDTQESNLPEPATGGKSMLGSVLSKLGYNNSASYTPLERGNNRDIELGEIEDQFIVSDDEDFIPGHGSNQNQNRGATDSHGAQ
ncbi:unnamed protein product [Ambrosiozyma monospora]|uniref:Unnamed protein product n=1 Tax=Ambrosiozyma monospora TaxID=43982 RepID=A0ACB5T5G4_AMBMO|nr:unnamed protein product [Ambrosiozyma monospora]